MVVVGITLDCAYFSMILVWKNDYFRIIVVECTKENKNRYYKNFTPWDEYIKIKFKIWFIQSQKN